MSKVKIMMILKRSFRSIFLIRNNDIIIAKISPINPYNNMEAEPARPSSLDIVNEAKKAPIKSPVSDETITKINFIIIFLIKFLGIGLNSK